jgi:hypothetical protein
MPAQWEVVFLDFKKFQRAIKHLGPEMQIAIVRAVIEKLSAHGPEVAADSGGRALGKNLYELKLSLAGYVLLRAFFAVRPGRIVVILSVYDKRKNDSKSWQNRQIQKARRLLEGLDSL